MPECQHITDDFGYPQNTAGCSLCKMRSDAINAKFVAALFQGYDMDRQPARWDLDREEARDNHEDYVVTPKQGGGVE